MNVERYKGRVCLAAGWMIDEGYLTKSMYVNLTNRKRLTVMRRGCNGRPALIDWDSVPSSIQQQIISDHGSPISKLRRNYVVDALVYDVEAEDFYTQYTYGDGIHLTPLKIEEYANNAMLLTACMRVASDLIGNRKTLGRVGNVWEYIAQMVGSINKEEILHSIPENHARLKERVTRYREVGYSLLIHRNFANKNAAKVDDQVKESTLLVMLSHPNNLDSEKISRMYNTIAESLDWSPITGSAVREWRKRHSIDIDTYRMGPAVVLNSRLMQVRRSKPTAPCLYWTIDGWDVELAYQATVIDKKGHKKQVYHPRMTVVVVLDPSVNYPIGYAIGTHETPELIRLALRNAVLHTAELFGERYRPQQLQTDNYGNGNLTPFYEEVCRIYTPAKIKNAKTKVIEPYFKYLNTNYAQQCRNWTGYGNQSRKESQPNSEAISKIRHQFPDQAGVIKQIESMMHTERMIKIDAYRELWDGMDTTKRLSCDLVKYLKCFGDRTLPNRLQGGGLQPRIGGEVCRWECFDPSIRKHSSERWVICYDPSDMTRALALSSDERYQFMLEKPHIQPMALMDRKEGDAAELQRISDYNQQIVTGISERYVQRTLIVGELANDERLLADNVLSRLFLPDSKGQHKNLLSETNGKIVKSIEASKSPKSNKVYTDFEELTDATSVTDYRELQYQNMDFNQYNEI